MASSKTLPAAQLQRARDFTNELVQGRFDGNVSKAATKIGVSQSWLAEFLKGKRGAGFNTMTKIAAFAQTTVDTILGGGAIAAEERQPIGAGAIGDRPDYPQAMAEARKKYRRQITDELEAKVARASTNYTPEVLTPEWLWSVAQSIALAEPFDPDDPAFS